jgi:hypothetical protein
MLSDTRLPPLRPLWLRPLCAVRHLSEQLTPLAGHPRARWRYARPCRSVLPEPSRPRFLRRLSAPSGDRAVSAVGAASVLVEVAVGFSFPKCGSRAKSRTPCSGGGARSRESTSRAVVLICCLLLSPRLRLRRASGKQSALASRRVRGAPRHFAIDPRDVAEPRLPSPAFDAHNVNFSIRARPGGSEQSQSTGCRYGVSARLHG